MNKVIHGAFRRDLNRFNDALANFPNGDAQRAHDLSKAWQFFHEELTRHHTGEHAIAWPALQQLGVSPELLAELDAEHGSLTEALDNAAEAMKNLDSSPTSESAASAAEAIAALRNVAEEHMTHEEAELDPVYLAKKDDPVMKAMGRQFGKASPKITGNFFAWLQDGASPDDQAALRANVPGPVIAIFGGLFGRSYRRTIAPVWHRPTR